jgi:dTDP-4-dehydrorhamnose reductase
LIVGVFLKNNILLLGGSGNLGSKIIKSKIFLNLKYPSKKELNILNKNKIEKYLIKNDIDLVLHCAALARLRDCEVNKKNAEKVNIIGTENIVKSILNIKKIKKKDVKLIFISSDAVYSDIGGNHKETDKPSPHNVYGFTKLKGEKLVRKVKHHMILRTRFFDKNKINFKYSAVNIFTSALEVNKLIYLISKLIKIKFHGTINVGIRKISDFKKYKKYKKNIKPCDKNKIFSELNFKIATDASLNLKKLRNLL